MSQRVPSWDLDEAPNITAHQPPPLHHHHVPSADHAAMSDYEVAELTWENGNVAMHGFGHPRICKPIAKYPSSGPMAAAMAAAAAVWEKPRQGGTLESIVDQATGAQFFPHSAVSHPHFLSWFGGPHQHMKASSAGTAAGVDALVPCSSSFHPAQHSDNVPTLGRGMGCSGGGRGRKRARAGDGGWNCTSQGSAAAPTVVTLDDTCELYGADDVEFTTTSSPDGEAEDGGRSPDTENTSFGGHDSVGHSRPSQRDGVGDEDGEKTNKRDLERSSISTKRSRAAAIHNQSERKRRDRINEKMKTLQKLVPNSSKTDKASMLDEVIDYLKQLQAQVQMISRMNSITHMMMPMAMPQLQMSMMANMSHMAHMAQMAQMAQMGMMDMSSLGRPGPTGMPPLLHPPAAFMPLAGGSWDASCNRMPHAGGAVLPDPFSAFFPCPSQQQQQQQQQMNMDAYNKMAALYQQLYQQPHQSNLKN